jgi:hypothetical protein
MMAQAGGNIHHELISWTMGSTSIILYICTVFLSYHYYPTIFRAHIYGAWITYEPVVMPALQPIAPAVPQSL